MNAEQVKEGIRWVVGTFGALAAGYFAAWSGWFSADQIVGALNSPAFLTLATTVVMGVWGIITRSTTNQVAAVGEIAKDPASPVKAVLLTDSKEGRDLAAKTPETVVVAPNG